MYTVVVYCVGQNDMRDVQKVINPFCLFRLENTICTFSNMLFFSHLQEDSFLDYYAPVIFFLSSWINDLYQYAVCICSLRSETFPCLDINTANTSAERCFLRPVQPVTHCVLCTLLNCEQTEPRSDLNGGQGSLTCLQRKLWDWGSTSRSPQLLIIALSLDEWSPRAQFRQRTVSPAQITIWELLNSKGFVHSCSAACVKESGNKLTCT